MSGQESTPDRMEPDRIELRGLRVLGTHGALPEEHLRAQPFEVDLDLELDLRPAGRSDRLADTVDYGSVTEAVAAVVAGPHVDLLEHLAERVARAALASGAPHATAVTVSVRKTRPPVPQELASAGVTIRRLRAESPDRTAQAARTAQTPQTDPADPAPPAGLSGRTIGADPAPPAGPAGPPDAPTRPVA